MYAAKSKKPAVTATPTTQPAIAASPTLTAVQPSHLTPTKSMLARKNSDPAATVQGAQGTLLSSGVVMPTGGRLAIRAQLLQEKANQMLAAGVDPSEVYRHSSQPSSRNSSRRGSTVAEQQIGYSTARRGSADVLALASAATQAAAALLAESARLEREEAKLAHPLTLAEAVKIAPQLKKLQQSTPVKESFAKPAPKPPNGRIPGAAARSAGLKSPVSPIKRGSTGSLTGNSAALASQLSTQKLAKSAAQRAAPLTKQEISAAISAIKPSKIPSPQTSRIPMKSAPISANNSGISSKSASLAPNKRGSVAGKTAALSSSQSSAIVGFSARQPRSISQPVSIAHTPPSLEPPEVHYLQSDGPGLLDNIALDNGTIVNLNELEGQNHEIIDLDVDLIEVHAEFDPSHFKSAQNSIDKHPTALKTANSNFKSQKTPAKSSPTLSSAAESEETKDNFNAERSPELNKLNSVREKAKTSSDFHSVPAPAFTSAVSHSKASRGRYSGSSHRSSQELDMMRILWASEKMRADCGEVVDWLQNTTNNELKGFISEAKRRFSIEAEKNRKVGGEDDEINLLFDGLQTGVLLCLLANSCDSSLNLKFNKSAQPGSFFARDNISKFLAAATAWGIPRSQLFESDDLVLRKNDRNVVNALLDVARCVHRKFGIEPPEIIKFEMEIAAEEAEEAKNPSQPVKIPSRPATPPTPSPPAAVEAVESQNNQVNEETEDGEEEIVADSEPVQPRRFLPRWLPYHSVRGDKLDEAVASLVNGYELDLYIKRVRPGQYHIADPKISYLRLVRSLVLVRVGGGWVRIHQHNNQLDFALSQLCCCPVPVIANQSLSCFVNFCV
jgi:hypothetical protein